MNAPRSPRLSVVMPVHNALPYLDESIGSILSQSLDDFELVILDDASTDGTGVAASALSLPPARCFRRLPDALDRAACEAVVVATSAETHPAVCEPALERGLAVLVEKPLALRLDEAVRLVDLAERRRAPLVVGQNYRYMRVHRAARRLIGDGALGRIAMVVSQ